MNEQSSRRQYKRWKSTVRVPGPHIPGYRVEQHDPSHQVFIDHTVIQCSPTEYTLLHFLLCHYGEALTFEDLIVLFDPVALDHADSLDRAKKRLAKFVSCLRIKLYESNLTIFTKPGVGYLLGSQAGYAPALAPRDESSVGAKSATRERFS